MISCMSLLFSCQTHKQWTSDYFYALNKYDGAGKKSLSIRCNFSLDTEKYHFNRNDTFVNEGYDYPYLQYVPPKIILPKQVTHLAFIGICSFAEDTILFPNVTGIWVNYNLFQKDILQKIPFNRYKRLKEIIISNMRMDTLPSNLFSNPSILRLAILNDSWGEIKHPVGLLQLKQLKTFRLDAKKMEITDLDVLFCTLSQMKKLKEVMITNINVDTIPPSLQKLKHINHLILEKSVKYNYEKIKL